MSQSMTLSLLLALSAAAAGACGCSSTSAIAASPSSSRRLQAWKSLQRIFATHAVHEACRKSSWNRRIAVELPVRIITGKQQHPIRADLVQELFQICLCGWRVKRLRGEPHVITHDVGGGTIDPRYLDADTLPSLVGAPHERGQPADARFHHDDLELGKLAEHAF